MLCHLTFIWLLSLDNLYLYPGEGSAASGYVHHAAPTQDQTGVPNGRDERSRVIPGGCDRRQAADLAGSSGALLINYFFNWSIN